MTGSLGVRKNGSADSRSLAIVAVANTFSTDAIVPPLAPPTVIRMKRNYEMKL